MLPLIEKSRYHPMLWRRADVEANAEGVLVLVKTTTDWE
jgi:hypothetical protein